jgi:hypothetical protein
MLFYASKNYSAHIQTIILLKHRRGIVGTPRRSVYYFADHKEQGESSSDTSPC